VKRLGASAALLLTFATAARAQDDLGIPLGRVPPAATVQDLDGNPVDLGRWIGRRPVVVEFWATWCSLCEALLPRMQAAHRRYGERVDFLVVGVGVNQSRRTMQRHLERNPMPFVHLFDATGAAVRAFLAPSTSYIVVLDATGRVVYTGIGEDQDIVAAVERAVGGR
jgi:thiol-disulfide isomerase/thioredoxin